MLTGRLVNSMLESWTLSVSEQHFPPAPLDYLESLENALRQHCRAYRRAERSCDWKLSDTTGSTPVPVDKWNSLASWMSLQWNENAMFFL